jgi:2-oxoglutarate dehydrogenase E1 component
MEVLNMSLTHAYGTGGSIHVVINNQVGFTTSEPRDLRSTFYCTDIGKMIEVPIFHVNADDPEAVIHVAQIAVDYRYRFNKNVIIDLVCYRRHGHNESDEPSGTQPLMYKVIKDRAPVRELYAAALEKSGAISKDFLSAADAAYRAALAAGKSVVEHILSTDTFKNRYIADWAPFKNTKWTDAFDSSLSQKKLLQLAQALDRKPTGFVFQKQVEKVLEDRAKMTAGEMPINWGYAEVLAYASIVDAGTRIRVTGEDCRRGTFSHRHAVLHHMDTEEEYTPLSNVSKTQAPFCIYDSILSEEGVLAFEYGYSSSAPNVLVLWEAQFGDFVNGAQVVIDQFISSAEEKWGRLCGLTLLLPHGYEGMGAEHSSARLERFLQLCAHDNMQVCVPTTPAQMYHLLRRQALKPYRKPLIVMTPKSLLRSPLATSTLEDLYKGQFYLVIPDASVDAKKIKRVVLCQGKVYYDLWSKRQEAKLADVALVRLEQLYPFPDDALAAVLKQYPHAREMVWCQEEPKNQGAWWAVRDHLMAILSSTQSLSYAGRGSFAAPAVGYPALHKEQQAELVQQALGIQKSSSLRVDHV